MSDNIRDALVEAVAEAIYVQWSTQAGYVPWVARGNSLKQGEARRIARSAIENGFPLAQQPAPAAPVAVGQEPVAWRVSDPDDPELGRWLSEEPGSSWYLSEPLYAAPTAPVAVGQELVEFDYPEYHEQGMGCGLEDRGITDRYEACRYGFQEAVDQCATIIESFGPLYTAPPAAEQPAAVKACTELLDALDPLLTDVLTAADLVRRGGRSKALADRMREHFSRVSKLRALLAGGDKP